MSFTEDTFAKIFAQLGPDVERIAAELGIKPHEVDRLINEKMDRRYKCRADNARIRSNLREIRRRHA